MFLAFLLLFAAPSAAKEPASIRSYDEKEAFAEWRSEPKTWEGFEVVHATFPSAVPSIFPTNAVVWVRLVLPKTQGPHPVVLSLPILAGSNLWVESRFWRPLLDRGIAVLFVELPFQFHRRPPGAPSGLVFLGRSPETLRTNFTQAILDVRRAVTWARRRPDLDKERVGLLGISLGALVGSATYAVDDRIKDAVFLLGGADLKHLLANSGMTGPVLRRLNIDPERLAIMDKEVEPLLYKESNADKPALLVDAWWDNIVPPANARKLKEAYPSSRQIWIPGGHYTSIVHLLWMPSVAARHFAESFGAK